MILMIWNLCNLSSAWTKPKTKCSMGGEIRRHASITQKVKAEMDRRREETGAYTPEAVTRQLEKEIEQLRGEI